MDNLQQSCDKKFYKGLIVGPLELIEEFPETQRWKVKCTKCGAEFLIVRSDIHKYEKLDKCKECGALFNSKTYPNGSIYGNLKVIGYLGSGTNKYLIECLNCHRQFEISGSRLLDYKRESPQYCKYCKPEVHKSRKYKPGQIIGNCYELIRLVKGNEWIVRCTKCGKEQSQLITNMKKHKKDTCYYCEHPYSEKAAFGRTKIGMYAPIEERMYSYYSSKIIADNQKYPTRQQKPFKLSLEEYSKLIHGNCYYCGEPPTADNMWNKSGKRKTSDKLVYVNGIDRIDSSKGYTIDNCVSCCPQCNRMKLDYTKDQFLQKVKQIYHKMFNDQSKDVVSSETK